MPARKPAGLIRRHDTKNDRAKRAADEQAMAPEHGLPLAPPTQLRGHAGARAAWRRCMRMYGELEAQIVNRLDLDLLVDYCLLVEQVDELDTMREAAYGAWRRLCKQAEAAEGAGTEEILQGQAALIVMQAEVVKLDGRADRKRALLHQMRQSLYLTPRSRAGASPARREAEPEADPMEQLLGAVTNYVNGAGDGQ